MKKNIKSIIAAMSLIGLLFIVSGCAELEPVKMDQAAESAQLVSTRASADGSVTNVYISPGTVLSAAMADWSTVAEITGPSSVAIDGTATFGISPAPPSGIIGPQWSISPSIYPITIVPPYSIRITFTSPATYVIQAYFDIPNGELYLTKTVNVSPPVLEVPEVYDDPSSAWPEGAVFRLVIPFPPEFTFDWEVNGNPYGSGVGPSISVSMWPGESVTVRCRSRKGNYVSAWSYPYTFTKSYYYSNSLSENVAANGDLIIPTE